MNFPLFGVLHRPVPMLRLPGRTATRKRREFRIPNPLEALELRRLPSATPTAAEQETLELINRLRTNPQGELNRLFSNLSPLTGRDANVNSAVRFFGVNGRTLESQWQSLVAVPPVAWNQQLASAAETHNNLIVTNQAQSHQFPGEPALLNRIVAAGTRTGRRWSTNVPTTVRASLAARRGSTGRDGWGDGGGDGLGVAGFDLDFATRQR